LVFAIYDLEIYVAITVLVPYLGGKYFESLARRFLYRMMFLVVFSTSAISVFLDRYEYTVSGTLIGHRITGFLDFFHRLVF
jgi:hypothetical protein